MTRRRRPAPGRTGPDRRTACRSRRLVRTRSRAALGSPMAMLCAAAATSRYPDSTRSPPPSSTSRCALASQPAAGAISPRPRCSTATQKALRTARATSPAPIESRYARRESSMLSAYSPTRYVAMARRSRSSTPRDASRSAANRRSRASAHAWRSIRGPAAVQGGRWRSRALRHRSSFDHRDGVWLSDPGRRSRGHDSSIAASQPTVPSAFVSYVIV